MNWKVFVACLLLPVTTLAQTAPIRDIPPGPDKIVPIEWGEKAPFTGQLFDPSTALRWGNWLTQYRHRLEWDVREQKKLCEIEVDYRDRILLIESERARQIESDLLERLERSEEARLVAEKEARNQPWYNTREFGVTLGVVGTVGIMALSIWALEVRK